MFVEQTFKLTNMHMGRNLTESMIVDQTTKHDGELLAVIKDLYTSQAMYITNGKAFCETPRSRGY